MARYNVAYVVADRSRATDRLRETAIRSLWLEYVDRDEAFELFRAVLQSSPAIVLPDPVPLTCVFRVLSKMEGRFVRGQCRELCAGRDAANDRGQHSRAADCRSVVRNGLLAFLRLVRTQVSEPLGNVRAPRASWRPAASARERHV